MTNSAYMVQKLNTYFGTLAAYGALTSTAPGTTTGTEISGGSPAYARKPLSWGTATTATPSVMSASAATFDVASGTTVVGFETYDAVTAGNYLNGAGITSQTFASQGTYAVTPTNTES
jgi:hypothetical protein